MKTRECGIGHLQFLSRDVQQHQRAVIEKPVHVGRVPGGVSPWAVGELVEIGVGRDEEQLLIDN